MDALQEMESKARFDIAQLLDGRLETKVQRVFYWDQLQLDTSRNPTATEIEKRWELMRRVLGPTLGRLEVEMLNPLINRVFAIMFRAGAFPPPPPDLADEDIDVEYEGPLARSQRTLRVTGLEQTRLKIGDDPTILYQLVALGQRVYVLGDTLRAYGY